MAVAKRTEVFDVEINKFYDVLIDYNSYPEYVDGVNAINILEQDEQSARVEYSLNLIKKFKYILALKQTRPTSLAWKFESGDLFKQNEGVWSLKDLGDGRTEVTFSLEINIKGLLPKSIINKLAANNLPAMMKSYADRAKTL